MPSPLDRAFDTVKIESGKRKLADRFLAIASALQDGQNPVELAGDAREALDRLIVEASPAPALEAQRAGDEFTYSYPSLGIAVGVAMLREAHDGLHAEVSVVSSAAGHLHWAACNLSSITARQTLAAKLEKAHPGPSWPRILERVCRETAEQFRAGEPAVELTPSDESLRYAVDKVLVLDEINEWYSDGGNLKSYNALAIALAVTQHVALPNGLTPRVQGPTLYLDYETNARTHQRRLGALMRGLGLESARGIFYRNPTRPLMDDVAAVRAEIVRRGAVLTIVDSFTMSIGGTSLIDAASPTMNALRSLPGTKLLINHVAKSHADQRGPTRALGTVAMMNGPRNAWELKAGEEAGEEDEGDIRTVAFYHAKTNDTRKHRPFALRYEFTETEAGVLTARIRAGDFDAAPDLLARTSLSYRLLETLKSGERTVDELAEEAEAAPGTIRSALKRLRERGKVVRLDEARGGKWGLRHA